MKRTLFALAALLAGVQAQADPATYLERQQSVPVPREICATALSQIAMGTDPNADGILESEDILSLHYECLGSPLETTHVAVESSGACEGRPAVVFTTYGRLANGTPDRDKIARIDTICKALPPMVSSPLPAAPKSWGQRILDYLGGLTLATGESAHPSIQGIATIQNGFAGEAGNQEQDDAARSAAGEARI